MCAPSSPSALLPTADTCLSRHRVAAVAHMSSDTHLTFTYRNAQVLLFSEQIDRSDWSTPHSPNWSPLPSVIRARHPLRIPKLRSDLCSALFGPPLRLLSRLQPPC